MLEAHIVSTRGSLYFAAQATPYDLEILRLHLRAFARDASPEVRLELHVDEGDAVIPMLRDWLDRLAAKGVHAISLPAHEPRPETTVRRRASF